MILYDDAISPEQKPGAKAGNPYLDIVFKEMEKDNLNKDIILGKILIFELCNTLDKIIEKNKKER